jgi:hypothetical protein
MMLRPVFGPCPLRSARTFSYLMSSLLPSVQTTGPHLPLCYLTCVLRPITSSHYFPIYVRIIHLYYVASPLQAIILLCSPLNSCRLYYGIHTLDCAGSSSFRAAPRNFRYLLNPTGHHNAHGTVTYRIFL